MSEEGRIRHSTFHLNLTEDELKLLGDKAKYCGLDKSNFLRKLIHDGAIIKVDYEKLDRLYFQLKNISHNVNEVAKFVNQTKMFSRVEFEKLCDEYESIIALMEKEYLGI